MIEPTAEQEAALQKMAEFHQENGLYDYPLVGDSSMGVREGPAGETDDDEDSED